MSQFVGFLEPPKKALEGYDSTQLHHAQADGIPEVFTDAMSVREGVYVEEQKVPLENEFDHDDPRSYHWVAYASVGTSSPEPTAVSNGNGAATGSSSNSSAKQQDEQRRKSSTANKLAVGTIRLVPPPHPPHPEPGSSHKIDNAEGLPSDTNTELSNKTSAQNPREPYIKLGRLAVLKPFRGKATFRRNETLKSLTIHRSRPSKPPRKRRANLGVPERRRHPPSPLAYGSRTPRTRARCGCRRQ